MLNTSVSNNSKTILNTPATGIIQKSTKPTFFIRMHYNSKLADKIFSSSPTYASKSVVVMQVMLIHEGWVLCELIYEDAFND